MRKLRPAILLLVWLLTTWNQSSARSPAEVIAQSSRLTSLVISEIMYHPLARADGRKLEFIELFNTLDTPQELSGYALAGDVDFTFPPGTTLAARSYLVVARNPTDLESVYGITGVFGPFANGKSLPNDSGVVRLLNRQGAVLLEVPYHTRAPWPVASDGFGPSIVLARPSFGEADQRAWAASDLIGGTPAAPNTNSLTRLDPIFLNELLLSPDPLQPGYIEIYNHSTAPLDLSGYVLTDDPASNKFVLSSGSIILPAGFLTFDLTGFPLTLDPSGGALVLKRSNGEIVDAIKYGAIEPGVPFGRSPDGAEAFSRLTTATPGSGNAPIQISDLVFNELMYDPVSGVAGDQYIELYNRSSNSVKLAGWTLDDGIKFSFPSNASVSPGGYVVVARDSTRIRANYPNLTLANTFGDFSGTLSHTGERVVLTKPVPSLSTNKSGVQVTNLLSVTVDEVTYNSGGRWGEWSHGGGSSLEKVDPRSDGRSAANWADSDESSKAAWTAISFTGRLDNGDVAADELQVLLQGPGECLIDNVQVLNSAGANLIANSDFEQDAAGWTAEGTEESSSWEGAEGADSSHSYHIRAVERGDNQVNRVRTALSSALAANSTATIRANVRWLKGTPGILLRLRGNWLELAGTMNLPQRPGTPGSPNNRLLANSPPAIFDVHHSPAVPAAGQSVLVTARISDPDGVGKVTLRYRVDPASTYTSVTLHDDGMSGDAVAGDGLYSGMIPGKSAGTLIAFYLTAADLPGLVSSFPATAPVHESLVRFGESSPSGDFPVYRIWMTQATLNDWTTRHKLNNRPLDVTFVLGNDRVIYNTQALYAGSPYIAPGYSSPTSGKCGYAVTFPSDDRFLGNMDLVLDWPGGHGGERTALQEQMAYWLAEQVDLPYSHRYTIRLQVNGVTDMQRGTVFEAVNQPAGDFVKSWVPNDSNGDFYKIDRAFEFNDGGGLVADPQPRLQNYTTVGGAKKTARYRWNFYKRAGSSANDYSNIFALVDAVNSTAPEPYTSATEALVDIDEWMGILAMEHIIVNFDAYGHEIGKNMYAYKPEAGKWQLYLFDLDWLMLAAAGRGPTYAASSAPLFNSEDPTISRMYNHPPFRRAYLRTIERAVNGPMRSEICGPVMDAKYQALVANGITLCDGQSLTDPTVVKTWFAQRRAFLISQLALASAPFALSSSGDYTTNASVVKVKGTAPIAIETIRVNGAAQPITWDSLTNWTVIVNLAAGLNILHLDAYDSTGALSGSAQLAISNSLPPLILRAARTQEGTIRITWNTDAGISYRILYKDRVADPNWTVLDTVVATSDSLTANLPPSASQRFYRISTVQ